MTSLQMIRSAEEGDVVKVRKLLDEGANVNAQDTKGRTALYWASRNSLSDVTLEILKRDDVNVNAQDTKGRSALYWASRNSLSDVAIEILKREDVNVNVKDFDGQTAPLSASRNSLSDVAIEILKREDVNVNVKDFDGQTAPLSASRNSLSDVAIEILKREDVNVNVKDFDGQTAPLSASSKGMVETFSAPLRQNDGDVNVKEKKRSTTLDVTRTKGIDFVARLLEDQKERPTEPSYQFNERCTIHRVHGPWPISSEDKSFADSVRSVIGKGVCVPCLCPWAAIKLLQIIDCGHIKPRESSMWWFDWRLDEWLDEWIDGWFFDGWFDLWFNWCFQRCINGWWWWFNWWSPDSLVLVKPGDERNTLITRARNDEMKTKLQNFVNEATENVLQQHSIPLTKEHLSSFKAGFNRFIAPRDRFLAEAGLKGLNDTNWSLSFGDTDPLITRRAVSQYSLKDTFESDGYSWRLARVEGAVTAIYVISGGLQYEASTDAVNTHEARLETPDVPVPLNAGWHYKVTTENKTIVAENNQAEWIIAIEYVKLAFSTA
ncbi:hypothetical protein MHU86_25218 [Fragilaria crotonensis]|nr:hypothetical protein MHU86_25218 [Fragilaria crotonensis]